MPPRGNQPHERVCEANWRRSLCAAKRDPRLGGCTPPRPPIRKSEGPQATRTQYYCSRLTPVGLPPLLSRELRGCERGATVERSETGERAMFAPAGQTTARACLLANCRRSLCADKRPTRGLPANDRLPYSCGPQMCGSYRTVTIPLQIAHESSKLSPKTMHSVENPLNKR